MQQKLFGRELLDQAMSLESLPYRGLRVKKRRGLLKLIHGNYLIYYQIKEQKRVVEIIAFKHGAQIKWLLTLWPIARKITSVCDIRDHARLSPRLESGSFELLLILRVVRSPGGEALFDFTR
jgi:mRNA-degrading endonuclease RelE of RelBE toxin-antitoxin system